MKNRSRIDTVAKILEVINDQDEDGDGVTQTTISYELFLGGALLKEYLIALTLHGLLSYEPTSRRYNTTKKGLRFLQIYYKISTILNQDNISSDNKTSWSRERDEKHLVSINEANLASKNSGNDRSESLDRLLIVDDDPDILQFLKLALVNENRFLVDAFTNPEEALQSFRTNAKAYRLMLSDIRMPSLSGIQLAKKVKEINVNVKVVLITAFQLGDYEFSEVFFSNKIDAFLQKPIGMADLVKNILSLL